MVSARSEVRVTIETIEMHRITFVARTRISATTDAVFDWHEAPGAFERLTPPWERVRVLSHEGGIRDGARHRMIPQGSHACVLEDMIEYELPLGTIGRLFGGPFVRRKLQRLFTYRHAVTRRAFEGPEQGQSPARARE